MNRVAARLEEARRQALADLAELEVQEAGGEIDPLTAQRLRSVYEAELHEAEAALDAATDAPPAGRSPRRMLAGVVLGVLAIGLVVVMVVQAIQPREPGGILTGGLPDDPAGRDLTQVSNEEMEAVVAANPDVVPMRLALANRYFEDGDYPAALPHYLGVLDRDPGVAQAWARVGWMAYVSGDPQTGAAYQQRSLEVQADYPEAQLFLGMILLYGLNDPAGALPLLETVAARDDLPEGIRTDVEAALLDAQTAMEGS